ncbi:hypothetical protein HPP92_005490 [Vanilla planifolia]|uniref:Uncharacterized protein n=1 Tax=Vanilla planifolia TaxID=51239 RepID=A0A835RLS6_VANPL|nr:hypothetical protein HPP92_005849 [Vanilla planifolia]KAG0494496.1 hypothetical protein HPP92_005490 [Vanilla planifolia]
MDRGEPTLVPEWYKGASCSSTGSSSSILNHHSWSSYPDEQSSGFSSRNKLLVSVFDQDSPRSFSFTERSSSSFRRGAVCNGSSGRDKDLPSRNYTSFGRSHRDRDRDRDREKYMEIRDRDKTLQLENGFSNHEFSLINGKSERDALRYSQTKVSGRRVDPWHKRTGHDSNKFSFDRDFPFLGADEKHVGSDITRVSSPAVSTTIHSFPVIASSIAGNDGWTSALAEVPPIVRGSGPVSTLSLSPSSALTRALCNSTSLNMAETIAQTPARVRTAPQQSNESQKIEELHRQYVLKLRPVTSMPKSSVINSADKAKTKGSRNVEVGASKTGQQSSVVLGHHAVHPAARSDSSKISQPGNFQVLNRERNGSSPTGKDSTNLTNGGRVLNSSGGVPLTPSPPPKGPINSKLKDGRVGSLTLCSYGEKKPSSQAQNRNEFFNSLRMKASPSPQAGSNDDSSGCEISSSNLEAGGQVALVSASAMEKVSYSSSTISKCSTENACEEPEKIAPDEEEAAFLRSLGWEENAGEEALTREEIESFLSEYKKRKPDLKLKK